MAAADLWSAREMAMMRSGLDEREAAADLLRSGREARQVEGAGYSWRQTSEDIELQFVGHPLAAEHVSQVQVSVRPRRLKVVLRGSIVFDDDLWGPVRPDESTWTVEQDGVLRIELQKVLAEPAELNYWPRCGRREPDRLLDEDKRERRPEEENNLADDMAERRDAAGDEVAQAEARPGTGAAVDSEDSESDSDSDADGEAEGEQRRRRPPTTGTAAERERLAREKAAREADLWSKGTKEEAWVKERPQYSPAGPVPAAEAWRREGLPPA